jgi:ABC-type transport system involved in cytochrome bd biosynthesis fused ATPase/permease subunit
MSIFALWSHAKGGAPGTSRSWWQLAVLFALAALVSGILLTGVSAWFLGAVALAGMGPAAFAFNYHVPAALVRLFAVTRTAAKYGERIAGHKAALVDQVSRRSALFSAMAAAPKVRSAGWQLGDQDRLADFIDDVEDVDFARLRVGLPLTAAAAGLTLLFVATLSITPLALAAILPVLLAAAACAGWLLSRVTAGWRATRVNRRIAGRRLGAALAAAVPLRAEHAWPKVLAASFASLSEAGARMLRSRREQAVLDAVIGCIGPLAALSVLAIAWLDGLRGEALLPAAFVAFSWLALGESVQGASRIIVARIKERAARTALDAWTAGPASAAAPRRTPPFRLRELEIRALPRHAPDGRRLGGRVELVLRAGEPTVLTGPSGCGKTSLLKQIAGWLEADKGGTVRGDGTVLSPPARRGLGHLALHDAAILSDSVRENLFAPTATDEECWAALGAVELDDRIRAAGGLDGWITQDTLSLGEAQRLNLARALLSPLPIVLLDEPVEHLDLEQARRIIGRLTTRLKDRILLVSSHGRPDAWDHAREFGLGFDEVVAEASKSRR